jgi:hypothetical protein
LRFSDVSPLQQRNNNRHETDMSNSSNQSTSLPYPFLAQIAVLADKVKPLLWSPLIVGKPSALQELAQAVSVVVIDDATRAWASGMGGDDGALVTEFIAELQRLPEDVEQYEADYAGMVLTLRMMLESVHRIEALLDAQVCAVKALKDDVELYLTATFVIKNFKASVHWISSSITRVSEEVPEAKELIPELWDHFRFYKGYINQMKRFHDPVMSWANAIPTKIQRIVTAATAVEHPSV